MSDGDAASAADGVGAADSAERSTKRGSTGETRPNGTDLLVECLEREGVDHVFGIPGEKLADMLMALKDSSIEFVPVRHEQGGRVRGRRPRVTDG